MPSSTWLGNARYLHSFPTQRSSDLAVPQGPPVFLLQERRTPEPVGTLQAGLAHRRTRGPARSERLLRGRHRGAIDARRLGGRAVGRDRKSTRLNSSHSQTSYAVFYLAR